MSRRRCVLHADPSFALRIKELAMKHVPRSIRSVMLASALAVLAGCENQASTSSRDNSDRYTFQNDTRERSSYDSRYNLRETDRATVAAAEEPRATSDRASRSETGRSSVAAGNGATRVTRQGDRTRYTMAYPTGDRNSSVML